MKKRIQKIKQKYLKFNYQKYKKTKLKQKEEMNRTKEKLTCLHKIKTFQAEKDCSLKIK